MSFTPANNLMTHKQEYSREFRNLLKDIEEKDQEQCCYSHGWSHIHSHRLQQCRGASACLRGEEMLLRFSKHFPCSHWLSHGHCSSSEGHSVSYTVDVVHMRPNGGGGLV